MSRRLVMMLLAGFALFLAACSGPTPTAEPQLVVDSPADVQRITVQDAKALVDGGQGALYDARSEAAYVGVHAAGAISFPASDASARAGEIPADKAAIFY